MTLRPYQIAGAEFLAKRNRAYLADDMGLGKSAQAVTACASLDVERPRITVICPASVCETWKREFIRWWPEGRGFDLTVSSYDMAARGKVQGGGDVLILDEAHYLKSPTAKRTRMILGEGPEHRGGMIGWFDRVYLLSGTPMPNHPAELWAVLHALRSNTIEGSSGKPYSYWQFVKKFCRTKDNGFGIQIIGGKNHDDLKQRLAPFMLRRLKSEVLTDLPPISFDNLYVEGRIEHTAETRAQDWALAEILAEDGVEGLAKAAPHVASLRRVTGLAKVAACVDWIKDFLESGRKLVVFAHHRDVIDALRKALPDAVGITGDTPTEARGWIVDTFMNSVHANVFIGQIQAAGTGITLTAASDVLFVESSWVPSDNSQAAMRVHRIGQKDACLVRFATLAGSIDEDIQRAVLRKSADIAKVLGGV